MIEIETMQDVCLARRAIKQRWPIKDDYRQAIINTLVEISIDRTRDDRHRIAAARGLIAADGLNQNDEHATANNANRSRFLEIATRLGLGSHFEQPPGIGTVIDSAVVDGAKRKPRKREVKKPKPDADKPNRGSRNKSAGNRKPKKKGKVSKRS